jgi:hypothetical protein
MSSAGHGLEWPCAGLGVVCADYGLGWPLVPILWAGHWLAWTWSGLAVGLAGRCLSWPLSGLPLG